MEDALPDDDELLDELDGVEGRDDEDELDALLGLEEALELDEDELEGMELCDDCWLVDSHAANSRDATPANNKFVTADLFIWLYPVALLLRIVRQLLHCVCGRSVCLLDRGIERFISTRN